MDIQKDEFVSLNEAQQIMGDNYLSPQEVALYFPYSSQRQVFSRIIGVNCDRELLERNKDCAILVPGSYFKILELHTKIPETRLCHHEGKYIEDVWYVRESFTENQMSGSCWYLVKRILPDSFGKTYSEGESLLEEGEEIPFACEIFYTIALYLLIKERRFFKRVFTFCKDIIDGCFHLHAGIFPPGYLDIRHYQNLNKAENIGIAPVRKIPFIFAAERGESK